MAKEYRKVTSDFLRLTRNTRRQREFSRSEFSTSPSPVYRRPNQCSHNLPKFKIATFYPTDVRLWFNQIKNQFDLHDIPDDDERYRLTCAALLGEVASDVRDVLLHPFLTRKYENLKSILIERRGLTTPERVNKVISGEKIGSDITSRFLRSLQKTAGFGTAAVWVNPGFDKLSFGKCQCRPSYSTRQRFIRKFTCSSRPHCDFGK